MLTCQLCYLLPTGKAHIHCTHTHRLTIYMLGHTVDNLHNYHTETHKHKQTLWLNCSYCSWARYVINNQVAREGARRLSKQTGRPTDGEAEKEAGRRKEKQMSERAQTDRKTANLFILWEIHSFEQQGRHMVFTFINQYSKWCICWGWCMSPSATMWLILNIF